MHTVDDFLFKYRWFPESLSKVNSRLNKKDTCGISKSFISNNKAMLSDAISNGIEFFTPFEVEHSCSTLFYLVLTFQFKGSLIVFNKIPLKTKLTSFLKCIYIMIRG